MVSTRVFSQALWPVLRGRAQYTHEAIFLWPENSTHILSIAPNYYVGDGVMCVTDRDGERMHRHLRRAVAERLYTGQPALRESADIALRRRGDVGGLQRQRGAGREHGSDHRQFGHRLLSGRLAFTYSGGHLPEPVGAPMSAIVFWRGVRQPVGQRGVFNKDTELWLPRKR